MEAFDANTYAHFLRYSEFNSILLISFWFPEEPANHQSDHSIKD
jgi:hypothetical protein